jgi:phosphatidylserine decarboxylase
MDLQRPRWFARCLKLILVRSFKIDMSESQLGIDEYPCFGELFARRLKPGSRQFDVDAGLLSPSDGALEQWGPISSGDLLQCKGKEYELSTLLGDGSSPQRFEGGLFATIYLAPSDYHRVHWPCSARLCWTRYLPGDRWPVNRFSVEHIDNLFCENERYVVEADLQGGGRMALVMVAATNVGDMSLDHLSPECRSSLEQGAGGVWVEKRPKDVKAGDDLGVFKMGSTVILVMDEVALAGWDLSALSCGPIKAGHCLGAKIH